MALIDSFDTKTGSRAGAVARAVSPPTNVTQGSIRMWVEFVVGSLREVFLQVIRFSSLLKTNTSKFQFDPECSDV